MCRSLPSQIKSKYLSYLHARRLGHRYKSSQNLKNIAYDLHPPSSSKEFPVSFSNLLLCHNRNRCVRIQKIPNEFCSEHVAFLLTPSFPSIDQDNFNQFTATSMPLGVWPPQSHHIVCNMATKNTSPSCSSHLKSAPATLLWPMPQNIALVRFAYVPSTQSDCIKCLMEHSEVYLLYDAETTSDGYVWMRQAPADILKSCVGKFRSSLAYDEKGTQIPRPSGLLQLTKDDNPFIQRSVKSK